MDSKATKTTQGTSKKSPAKKSDVEVKTKAAAKTETKDAASKAKKDSAVKEKAPAKAASAKTATKAVKKSTTTTVKKAAAPKSAPKKAQQETVTPKKSKAHHSSVEVIQSAVNVALSNYSNHHSKSTTKSKSGAYGAHEASFFNHSQRRLNDAIVLSEAINAPKIALEDVMHTIRRFFNDASTVFHNHSFPTYLADALSQHDIVTRHGYKHYSQGAVLRELKKWYQDNQQ